LDDLNEGDEVCIVQEADGDLYQAVVVMNAEDGKYAVRGTRPLFFPVQIFSVEVDFFPK
jgi:hypothetical protein